MNDFFRTLFIGAILMTVIYITFYIASFGWHEGKSTVEIRDELWIIETIDRIKKKGTK